MSVSERRSGIRPHIYLKPSPCVFSCLHPLPLCRYYVCLSDKWTSDSIPSDDLIAVRCDLLENLGHQVIDLFFEYDYKADQDNDDQYDLLYFGSDTAEYGEWNGSYGSIDHSVYIIKYNAGGVYLREDTGMGIHAGECTADPCLYHIIYDLRKNLSEAAGKRQ